MDRRARLPLARVVVVAVVALLTGVAAVAVSARSDGHPPRVVPDAPAAEPEAMRVLRAWDLRRARAYAMADEAALRALYAPGSRTGAADLDLLRAYRERGLRVVGMRTRVLEARVVHETDSRVALVVTDVLLDARAVDARDVGWALPRDGPSTRRVVLVRDGGWRVAEVYPAT